MVSCIAIGHVDIHASLQVMRAWAVSHSQQLLTKMLLVRHLQSGAGCLHAQLLRLWLQVYHLCGIINSIPHHVTSHVHPFALLLKLSQHRLDGSEIHVFVHRLHCLHITSTSHSITQHRSHKDCPVHSFVRCGQNMPLAHNMDMSCIKECIRFAHAGSACQLTLVAPRIASAIA
jgi:hypothetical protein